MYKPCPILTFSTSYCSFVSLMFKCFSCYFVFWRVPGYVLPSHHKQATAERRQFSPKRGKHVYLYYHVQTIRPNQWSLSVKREDSPSVAEGRHEWILAFTPDTAMLSRRRDQRYRNFRARRNNLHMPPQVASSGATCCPHTHHTSGHSNTAPW